MPRDPARDFPAGCGAARPDGWAYLCSCCEAVEPKGGPAAGQDDCVTDGGVSSRPGCSPEAALVAVAAARPFAPRNPALRPR